MTPIKRVGLSLGAVLVLLVSGTGLAGMSSDNYQIPNDVISGGGTAMSSGSFQMESTLGQSSPLVINQIGGSTSTSYVNYPGFWQADWGLWDADGDSLSNNAELGYDTDPFKSDTDGDGLNDYIEAVVVACLDPLVDDTDVDGLLDGTTIGEDVDNDGVVDQGVETDPCDPDTDDDGLNDGLEVGSSLNPLYWDTDGDFMPDGFEVANSVGHTVGENLNALEPADGSSDFDGDSIENAHEYWNGSDPWAWNPRCGEGCYCWGDASGDGVPDPIDYVEMKKMIRSQGPDYSLVIPQNGLSHDLDADGVVSPTDMPELKKMVRNQPTAYMGSRPNTLVVLEQPGSTAVAVGDTCHVTIGVINDNTTYQPSLGVIFTLSGAAATLLGGEGPSGAGRYDVSEETGTARVVLKIEDVGEIYLDSSLPGCGVIDVGRYCPPLTAPTVTIIGQ